MSLLVVLYVWIILNNRWKCPVCESFDYTEKNRENIGSSCSEEKFTNYSYSDNEDSIMIIESHRNTYKVLNVCNECHHYWEEIESIRQQKTRYER